MVQIIGLMIACYTMVRMVQIPLELAAVEGQPFMEGMGRNVRLIFVTVIAAGAFVVLGLLALLLLVSGAETA